jgi:hypothetical protein
LEPENKKELTSEGGNELRFDLPEQFKINKLEML